MCSVTNITDFSKRQLTVLAGSCYTLACSNLYKPQSMQQIVVCISITASVVLPGMLVSCVTSVLLL